MNGDKVLKIAVVNDNTAIVKLLLAHSANFKAKPSWVNRNTVLQITEEKGHTKIVEQLSDSIRATEATHRGRVLLLADTIVLVVLHSERTLDVGTELSKAKNGIPPAARTIPDMGRQQLRHLDLTKYRDSLWKLYFVCGMIYLELSVLLGECNSNDFNQDGGITCVHQWCTCQGEAIE